MSVRWMITVISPLTSPLPPHFSLEPELFSLPHAVNEKISNTAANNENSFFAFMKQTASHFLT